MKPKTAKEIGDFGEKKAIHYLRLHGYTVKEHNYRAGHYEIDIIASKWNTLAFTEVKTRTFQEENIENAPPPGCAVKYDKQRFTRQAAMQYLREHPTRKKPRMDVIEIWLVKEPKNGRYKVKKIHHIIGAY